MGTEYESYLVEEQEKEERLHREELETAWLRGWVAAMTWTDWDAAPLEKESAAQAADYAERVVGGSTRPPRPTRYPTPSKGENAS